MLLYQYWFLLSDPQASYEPIAGTIGPILVDPTTVGVRVTKQELSEECCAFLVAVPTCT
jgi:hypothetical protein